MAPATRLTAYALLALGAVAANLARTRELPQPPPLGIAQVSVDSLAYVDEPMDARFLDVLRAEETVFRTYGSGSGEPVWVFLGYFSRQKEGSQVHSPRHCYPGSGWSILEEGTTETPWGDGTLTTLVVSNGTDERLVRYWFQLSDVTVNDVFDLKVRLTKNALLGRAQEVVFARVSTPLAGDRAAAAERLGGFVSRLHEGIATRYAMREGTVK